MRETYGRKRKIVREERYERMRERDRVGKEKKKYDRKTEIREKERMRKPTE